MARRPRVSPVLATFEGARMDSGPMFRWECLDATRRRRPFVFRSSFGLGLVAFTLFYFLVIFLPLAGMEPRARLVHFGRFVFLGTIAIEMLVLIFFIPSYVAGSIAEDRQRGTLPLLMLTRLTRFEIVSTKAVARWWPTTDPVLIGLPILVASGWAARLQWESLLATLAMLSTSAFLASLAILASSRRDQAGTARAESMGWNFLWFLGPPIGTVLPIPAGTFWGDLFVGFQWVCSLVAPTSPLSFLTDPGWYTGRPGSLDFEGRIALLIGLQAMIGLAALVWASTELRAGEKPLKSLDPTRGHRPACGDDPILWREFELPMRRGAGPILLIRLRYLRMLIRVMLFNLLAMITLLVTVVVPIGLVVGTIYLGHGAFRELWAHGYDPKGPFVARLPFNLLIRAATGMLALLPMLNIPSIVSARIAAERDKKSWDIFLTTPLEGREILRSKATVALHGLWQTGWLLPIVWALGLACGVILPMGVALAAVDLALLAWASVALGLLLGVRPGPTVVASNRSALWMLIFLLFHSPVLGAALVSPPEFAAFSSWSLKVRAGLVLVALAVPVLTGLLAWWWTRQVVGRFDEWVGRPIASGRINPP
jgi:hypothetical protein